MKEVRSYYVSAICDQCGVERTWTQDTDPADPGESAFHLGFDMRDPRWSREPKGLWFHERDCLMRWVDANIVEYLRHPEGMSA